MAVPTIAATRNDRQLNTPTVTINPPAGIQDGDLLIAFVISITAGSVNEGSAVAKGWARFGNVTVNSRYAMVLARVYSSATPTSDYAILLNAQASPTILSLAVRGHAVTSPVPDITLGAVWRRQDNGGSQLLIVAPSVTAPAGDSLALAFMMEATTIASTRTLELNGFTLVEERPELSGESIDWGMAFAKPMPTAGPTGNISATYNSDSLNGYGFQFVVPGPESTGPTVGEAVLLGTFGFSDTTLTVGAKQIVPGVTEAVLRSDVGTELDRVPVTFDVLTTWGHVTFTGLDPQTAYRVSLEVDGEPMPDEVYAETLITDTPLSFTFVTGSCHHTGSNHPIFDRILADSPAFLAHMGDLHYADSTTDAGWRTGVEASLRSPRFSALLRDVPLNWGWDNHDRILADAGGTGGALNFGVTDPATLTQWRRLRGAQPLPSVNSATWVHGRARFIQTDMWTVRDDPDFGTAPRTFLGAEQKQWWKDTLEAATEPVIFWFANWPAYMIGSGRWGSYPDETNELVAWLDARPHIKRRMVMFGGDSHSLQADDGGRTAPNFRFKGIPSLNISGLSRTSDSGSDNVGWNIVNAGLRAPGEPENVGAYGRCRVFDDGASIRFEWEGVRVLDDGTTDIVAHFSRSFTPSFDKVVGADVVLVGDQEVWRKDEKGTTL